MCGPGSTGPRGLILWLRSLYQIKDHKTASANISEKMLQYDSQLNKCEVYVTFSHKLGLPPNYLNICWDISEFSENNWDILHILFSDIFNRRIRGCRLRLQLWGSFFYLGTNRHFPKIIWASLFWVSKIRLPKLERHARQFSCRCKCR